MVIFLFSFERNALTMGIFGKIAAVVFDRLIFAFVVVAVVVDQCLLFAFHNVFSISCFLYSSTIMAGYDDNLAR